MNPLDFVGTRTRFQRLRDCKLFNGWIEAITGERITVTSESRGELAVDDEFRFEAFGNGIAANFVGKFEAVQASSSHETISRTLIFKAVTAMRFTESHESARHKVKNLPACLTVDEVTIVAECLDASITGIGVRCPTEVKQGTIMTVSIQTPLGPVTSLAECRHCSPDPAKPSTYRIGILFVDMNRVARPKWERYVSEVL